METSHLGAEFTKIASTVSGLLTLMLVSGSMLDANCQTQPKMDPNAVGLVTADQQANLTLHAPLQKITGVKEISHVDEHVPADGALFRNRLGVYKRLIDMRAFLANLNRELTANNRDLTELAFELKSRPRDLPDDPASMQALKVHEVSEVIFCEEICSPTGITYDARSALSEQLSIALFLRGISSFKVQYQTLHHFLDAARHSALGDIGRITISHGRES